MSVNFLKVRNGLTFKSSAVPATPENGDTYYDSSSNALRVYQNGVWTTFGYPAPFPNYIVANSNAEVDTTGWATYSNTAANIPSNGTGGTATGLTFSRSISSPLRGVASFSLVQTNSTNIQGKGVSYAFTIDSADQAKVLGIAFDYNASSTFVASNGTTAPLNDGTTTTNAGNSDLEVFVYDVTNAVLIPVSPEVLLGNGTNNFTFNGIFQTNSNSTSYRLILHVATSNANAAGWTVKFDNVFVGRAPVAFNASNVSDWVAYTPATYNGLGTPTNVTFWWRRSGDSIEIMGTLNVGTVTAAEARIDYPSGITSAGSDKIPSLALSGYGTIGSAGNSAYTVLMEQSKTYMCISRQSSLDAGLVKQNGNEIFTNGLLVGIFCRVPVTGWATPALSSADAVNGVVAAIVNGTPATTTANNPIIWPTVESDTHSAYSASTGKYTIPIAGYYLVTAVGVITGTTGATFSIYKNGTLGDSICSEITGGVFNGSGTVKCVAGDLIDIRCGNNITAWSATATNNVFSISRVSGSTIVNPVISLRNEIVLDTGNGYGSTNTAVRRYSNTRVNTGTAMTLTQSAANGDSITINAPGIYTITCQDIDSGGSWQSGITVNSSSQTTNTGSLTYANGKRASFLNAATQIDGASVTLVLAANDVIRIQGNAGGTTDNTILHVTQVGV